MGKSKTIFRKTFTLVLTILLIVIGLFILYMSRYVLKNLRTNILTTYEEQIINSKNFLESTLLRKQNALNKESKRITKEIEELVRAKGYELSDIKQNAGLNQDILDKTAESIIYTLGISGATEIFLILDGYGSNNDGLERAGIYIRNKEPGAYAANYDNLVYERGTSIISERLNIPADIFWQEGFVFEDEDSNDFFFRPLLKAQDSDNLDFRNLAYWTYGNIIDKNDLEILSCSFPLIGSRGEVFGVLGIGINENYLMNDYSYYEIGKNASRTYILAKTRDGINYKPYFVKGDYYDKDSILSRNITLTGQSEDGIFYISIDAPNNDKICVSRQALELYNYSTPYEIEAWTFLGIQNADELLADYYYIQNSLHSILLISAILCIICIYWFSRLISVPIQQMVASLRKSDPNTPIRLNKTYIEEIDELAESIENLSARLSKRIVRERDYDVLTNLLSRRGIENKLLQLKTNQADLKTGAMLVWDLDNLKLINDNFGHAVGDKYLIAFANCLRKFNSDNVISARRSGDEFVTFIYGYNSVQEIENLIDEILQLVNSTYIVVSDNRKARIGISMGKAWYPKDSDDFDTLFRQADSAMYEVKYRKKGDFRNAVLRNNHNHRLSRWFALAL